MPKRHAVVDGSNLATEGRSEPSLAQLEEAVTSFAKDHNFAHLTVIVDASFEHRVAKKEQAAVKRAIDEGRIVTPPAGVVGRGDTFILQIADRADAVVVSNDSFQEFHGQFEWLFDEGRLIGGKPIEHVGWVFVPRKPVRGPTSREAVRKANSADEPRRAKKAGTRAAKATKPSKKQAAKKTTAKKAAAKKAAAKKATTPPKPVTKTEAGISQPRSKSRTDGENPVRAWQKFRREHPVGTSVEATVERFSSHGAYAITADGLSAYLPLRLLSDPAPGRARDVIAVGEPLSLVVHGYDEDRRGIDLGLLPVDAPASAPAGTGDGSAGRPSKKSANKKRAQKTRNRDTADDAPAARSPRRR